MNGIIKGLCQGLRSYHFKEDALPDHYKILKTLGQGAFMEVKLAGHLLTQIMIAVKNLPKGIKNTVINSTAHSYY